MSKVTRNSNTYLTPHSIPPPSLGHCMFSERKALYEVLDGLLGGSAPFPQRARGMFVASRSTQTAVLSLTNSFLTMIVMGCCYCLLFGKAL